MRQLITHTQELKKKYSGSALGKRKVVSDRNIKNK